MSSYTPSFFGADSIVAQAAVDTARAQVTAAGQARKYATTTDQKAAAEQALVRANDNLIIAQNNLRLAKNPQAASTVIDSSKGTTVSDIQKFFSQPVIPTPNGSGYQPPPPPDSLQQAIQQQQVAQPTISTDVSRNVSTGGIQSGNKSKIPWILIAGIAFFAVKVFIMKKVTSQSRPATEGAK